MNDKIIIQGARVNNLKNVSLEIPLGKLTCFMGPSGSGKSSLAFGTLYKESQRRLMNSFPNSVKFFMDKPAAVDVDLIYPVLPCFGLAQYNPIKSSRSNVADICQLSGLLQNLYSVFAEPCCSEHGVKLIFDQHLDDLKIIENASDYKLSFFLHRKDYYKYFAIDHFPSRSFHEAEGVRLFNKEDSYFEVWRVSKKNPDQLFKYLEEYQNIVSPLFYMAQDKVLTSFSIKKYFKCPISSCEERFEAKVYPAHFSSYNALGACKSCSGFGEKLVWDERKFYSEDTFIVFNLKKFAPYEIKFELETQDKNWEEKVNVFWKGKGKYPGALHILSLLERKRYRPAIQIMLRNLQKEITCPDCLGTRLSSLVQNFSFQGLLWKDLWHKNFSELKLIFDQMKSQDSKMSRLLLPIQRITEMAQEIGIGHLALLRKTKSLSTGEYQRLLLLKFLSYEGSGSLFVLDEPSLGLDEKEQEKLYLALRKLIDLGNTVVLVEHNDYFLERADCLFEFGPGAGERGGEVKLVSFAKKKKDTFTSKTIQNYSFSEFKNISCFDRHFADAKIYWNAVSWIHGPSGSGKTSVFVRGIANFLAQNLKEDEILSPSALIGQITGSIPPLESIFFSSSNYSTKNQRSSVGNITELSSVLRKHFLALPVAKALNLQEGHFSPHSELGKCSECSGKGVITIEMTYLEDIELVCETCQGKKIKPLYADISNGEFTYFEATQMPLASLLPKLELTPKFKRISQLLSSLKIDYLSLERNAAELSGGERQRLALLSHLKRPIQNSVLIFENLSFGLSPLEKKALGQTLEEINAAFNTILIIDNDKCWKSIAHHEIDFH